MSTLTPAQTHTAAPPPATAAMSRLPFRSLIGYGAGDFSNNLGFTTAGYFLMYYLTDSVGLSAGAAGTMFLVIRVWDAFADLFAGGLVDRTQTRWGKFRPFFLFAGLPMLLLSVVQFNIPQSLAPNTRLIYAYAAYALFGLAYSLVNIPYGALASAMSQSVHERAKLVSARSLGTGVATVVITYALSPFIDRLGARAESMSAAAYREALQQVFLWSTLAFVVLGGAGYLLTFLFTREQVVRDTPRLTVRQQWNAVKGNKALGILCLTSLFYLVGMFATFGAMAYYTRTVMGGIAAMAPITLVAVVLQFLYTPFIPKMIDAVGKKNLYQYTGLLTVVGCAVLFLAPRPSYWIPFIGFQIMAVAQGLINTLMFGLEADTVEYGEWVSGHRSEGATYAAYSFLRKMTSAIGGWVGGMVLAFGGYLSATADNPHPVQPASAVNAIVFSQSLIPAVCAVLAMIAFIKYPLTDERFKQIRNENEARKAAARLEATSPAVD